MKTMLRLPILYIALAGWLLAACADKLDDPTPDTSIDLDHIRDNDIPLLLRGAYRPSGIYYQSYPVWDVYSDDIVSLQGTTPAQFNPRSYEDCNPNIEDGFGNGRTYNGAYAAIGNANFIINYIRSRHATALSHALGEALTIRAYHYLRLVEAYGGVILTVDMETDINTIRRNKNTEDEVYQRVIGDLEEAIPLLGTFSTPDVICKQTAQLLLARVYLQRGNLAGALTLAEAVIAAGGVSLHEGDFGETFRFSSNSPEMLWRISEPITNYDRSGLYAMYSPAPPFRGAAAGLTWVDPALVDSYESSDRRRSVLYKQYSNSVGEEVTYLLKFSTDTLQPPSDAFIVYPLVRLSEAYLISAEATARMGTVDVTRFNALRSARGASMHDVAAFPDADDFLAEIERERRREFVGEGRRWQDMRRFGTAIPFLQSKGRDATRLYLPFNTAELIRNPRLEQNEGY